LDKHASSSIDGEFTFCYSYDDDDDDDNDGGGMRRS
jgi:hypothetical protein